MSFLSCEEMLAAARSQKITLAEAVLRSDLDESRLTEEQSRAAMHHLWQVMQATSREYDPAQRSRSGLSGGEKQRISIARAILKDAPIVILDEATSSVDPENEQALLSAIEELTKNKTLISIAHRLSTVQKADQIIVIDNGHVKQKGTHDQLSKKDGIYRNFLKLRVEATGWQL